MHSFYCIYQFALGSTVLKRGCMQPAHATIGAVVCERLAVEQMKVPDVGHSEEKRERTMNDIKSI